MAPNDKREERKVIDHYAYTVKRYKEGDGSGKPNKSVEVIIENLAPPKNTETITLLKHDAVSYTHLFPGHLVHCNFLDRNLLYDRMGLLSGYKPTLGTDTVYVYRVDIVVYCRYCG